MSDLSALVVASKDGESVFEADFQRNEESYSLDRVVATVDVVTHEQVVGVGRLASNFEKFAQVMELSVDVTADGHWGLHTLDIGLINQDFFRLHCNEKLDQRYYDFD